MLCWAALLASVGTSHVVDLELSPRARVLGGDAADDYHGDDHASSSYHALHLSRGAVTPTHLVHAEWVTGGPCEAIGEVYDFWLNVTEDHGAANLLIEVALDPAEVHVLMPDVLTFTLYPDPTAFDEGDKGRIPSTRSSERVDASTFDNSWSLAVGAHEIEAGQRYYVSVTCGVGSEGLSFGVLAEFEDAELEATYVETDGTGAAPVMHGHICENEWMFFFANLTDGDAHAHARFLVSAEGAEAGASVLALLPRDGMAPQRLAPPFAVLEGATGELDAEATLCAGERGGHSGGGHGGGGGLVWLGVYAAPGTPCTGLAISLELFEDNVGDYGSHACHRMPVPETGSLFSQASSSQVLPLNTARLGSCQPNEWVDYEVSWF